ncbi:hypothetical protein SEA_YABOI_283 [Streptomyces phage Yaboi]|uniref:Uncharacterized protein n=3 Tax=Streptomyces virus Yaboi TaxID=2846408 RepID=A0A411CG70_9CAUD|nr:hypothetical protein HWB86_gp022 [Streptomyces phage Yaboi]YP_009841374.1 hypothetical protein HWB86_gp044 [Streptomyces phage Yaboi]QAY08685.1 hypothetical protein SEA_GENIE2_23 [Streptomyces phage Genie2]QAY12675.1 hypothetical protein SEA_BOOMERJR_23 [Streptomyces phage BoomerJR]UVD39871.1 hypothetical protein SEA_STANIMAL_23 [Streptomyces phage Stanimal]WNM73612.1 hypothetical protein SEA_SOLLERTIA_23 [Streptomyces phage Sollertia]AYB70861.1 hypothetical protein SEA_YABOI_22 [Streptomy
MNLGINWISEGDVYVSDPVERGHEQTFLYVEVVDEWIKVGHHNPRECLRAVYPRTTINRAFKKVDRVPNDCACQGQFLWRDK